jgi:RNA polymerase sigma-70 factor (ECF subfamily)
MHRQRSLPKNAGLVQSQFMEQADRLHAFVQKRIPKRLQGVLAADDVLQEVWLSAFRAHPHFKDDSPDALDRWLTRIAERKLVDSIRRARRRKRGGADRFQPQDEWRRSSFVDLFVRLSSDGRSPSSESAAKEAVRAVQVALRTLPDSCRETVTMCHIEGRTRAEIAHITGRTPAAVNSLLYRGLRMLRDRLKPGERFFSDVSHGKACKR